MTEQQAGQDRIFDGWAERFDQRIYAGNNPKGAIRQALIRRDLYEALPALDKGGLRILDIGGGLGQNAIWLAGLGHQVTLSEPSRDMRDHAQQRIKDAGCEVRLLPHTLQAFSAACPEQFDLVLCHAVLEWLAAPLQALDCFAPLLSGDGRLSLMFYNLHSAMMRSLVVGDFSRALSDNLGGDGIKRLAPISPLVPQSVIAALPEAGLQLLSHSGVRCFYDYMLPQVRAKADTDSVIEAELQLSRQDPWRPMARYQHLICKQAR
ncbi:methyltransferase domain-containing protein [Granulosicoccaceae sp. 1_MG-2023]|nr:methyltransferase domain-containing protein [Granulosicoccaceae sp. 1_MG-2023]